MVFFISSCSRIQDSLDTAKYASGYSEDAFNKIKLGDSKESVINRLGAPLYKRTAKFDPSKNDWNFGGNYTNGYILFVYSESTKSSDYRQRSLVLDLKHNLVVYKISRFYVD